MTAADTDKCPSVKTPTPAPRTKVPARPHLKPCVCVSVYVLPPPAVESFSLWALKRSVVVVVVV